MWNELVEHLPRTVRCFGIFHLLHKSSPKTTSLSHWSSVEMTFPCLSMKLLWDSRIQDRFTSRRTLHNLNLMWRQTAPYRETEGEYLVWHGVKWKHTLEWIQMGNSVLFFHSFKLKDEVLEVNLCSTHDVQSGGRNQRIMKDTVTRLQCAIF